MVPYLIVFLVISTNVFFNDKDTKYFRYFSLITFVLFIMFYALRNNVGVDWSSYEKYFYNINNKDVIDRYKFEVGYWGLNYIAYFLLGSYRYLVFLVGIFNGILFWKSTNRYTKNIGIAILLSLYYMFYPTLEAFRQSLTIFIFYYSLEYIEKDEKKYILLNIIGFLFHRTGIFTLLFYVFNKYKKMQKYIILSLLLLLLLPILDPYIFRAMSIFPVLASKYHYYFHVEAVKSSLFSFKTLEYFLLLIFFLIISKRNTLKKYENIAFNLLLLGFVLQITIGQLSNIVYRITYYTDIGIVLAYIFIYDRIKKPVFKYLYIGILIIYVFLRFYRVFPFNNPRFFYNII